MFVAFLENLKFNKFAFKKLRKEENEKQKIGHDTMLGTIFLLLIQTETFYHKLYTKKFYFL